MTTQQFQSALPQIEERVKQRKRLTLKQSECLLNAYHERDKLREELDWVKGTARKLEADLEVEQDYAARMVDDWNEMCHMLDRVFGYKVYCNTTDDLWTIEYQEKKSTGHKSVADAYEAALSDKTGKDDTR